MAVRVFGLMPHQTRIIPSNRAREERRGHALPPAQQKGFVWKIPVGLVLYRYSFSGSYTFLQMSRVKVLVEK
jgi:hypothetical protein